MVPPLQGDVTGIQPINRRNVVYVVQNGELSIYDTTTDKLQTTQVDIIGQAVDVKAGGLKGGLRRPVSRQLQLSALSHAHSREAAQNVAQA